MMASLFVFREVVGKYLLAKILPTFLRKSPSALRLAYDPLVIIPTKKRSQWTGSTDLTRLEKASRKAEKTARISDSLR